MRRIIRFGMFEVDLEAEELRKAGIRVKLQTQPFRVLSLLLERPGEIVTRAEIVQALWGDNTFVDFDQSVGAVIRKLRAALGDSAAAPRYIETLRHKGYRFLLPCEKFAPAICLERSFHKSQLTIALSIAVTVAVILMSWSMMPGL